jgi:hypothetical protein
LTIDGDLKLSHRGPSSGGYIADIGVIGKVKAGSQQQFFARNGFFSYGWEKGVWNIVLVGNINAPKSHCGNNGSTPITKVAFTPVIQEKPYLV